MLRFTKSADESSGGSLSRLSASGVTHSWPSTAAVKSCVLLMCATTDTLIRPTDECGNNGCDDLLITPGVDGPIVALLVFGDNQGTLTEPNLSYLNHIVSNIAFLSLQLHFFILLCIWSPSCAR